MPMHPLVKEANKAYYDTDEKIITDSEFDLLADNGLEMDAVSQTINFRKKVDHFQPMGSLKKIKTEKDYLNFCPEGTEIKISPKLDGNSIELIVVDGKFAQAITRGNGFIGNDVSDKVQHCNIIHNVIPDQKHYSLKCEAIMKKEYQKDYDRNIRNVVAGLLNRKTAKPEELAKIDIIPFIDLDFTKTKHLSYNHLENGYAKKKEAFPYDIDGIVVEIINPIHEEKDELLPENIKALKFNKEGVDAEIGKIEWGLGKHAKLTPVIVLKEAVEIDGTMVQRVTASNWSLLVAAGLGVGAKVQVIKSGDIIPYISKVVKKSGIITVPECPVCGSIGELNKSKIQMICSNPDCKGKNLIKLQHIFKVFDLDYISDATVKNLYEKGFVRTIDHFFRLTKGEICGIPGFGVSKATNIVHKLKNVELTEAQVLKCAMIQGISESNGQRIIDFFGSIENFLYQEVDFAYNYSDIDGFADKTGQTIIDNHQKFVDTYETLKKYITIKSNKKIQKNEEAPKIVFTGKCEKYNRKELTNILKDQGYDVQKNINKQTQVLLLADINSSSSKAKKARDMGITILTYDGFFSEE